jgi:membrane protease YdiL (CAAX protease family)
LAFAISWGGLLLAVGGPSGIPATQAEFDRLMPLVIPGMLFGPAIAGLAMTGLMDGRKGYRALLATLLTWRVGVAWYAVALLTAPLAFAAVLLPLSLVSPAFVPSIVLAGDRVAFLLMGISAGLTVGFFEELGWSGFAIPRWRARHTIVASGLLAGILWGAWHLLSNVLWAASVTSGTLPVALVATVNGILMVIGQLAAYRVLMVWVLDGSRSLLVAMLMHASLTASTFILGPVSPTGMTLLVYGAGMAVAMWLVVAALALVSARSTRSLM